MLNTLWQKLAVKRSPRAPSDVRRRRHDVHPRLEALEQRVTPALFLVNTLADTVDGNPNITSLRKAIISSNVDNIADTINFSVGGTITLASALPLLSQPVDIAGPGASSLSVSGANSFSVFGINSGITSTISGLTITGGSTVFFGGGIDNRGTLTVSYCTIRNNAAGIAGGIENQVQGTLTVRNCTISGNTGIDSTGGIDNAGSLTLRDSSVIHNSGDGIFNTGTLSASNCTIAGNTGGCGLLEDGGSANLTNSTITGNIASNFSGGGIRLQQYPGVVTLQNTIVAGNFQGTAPDDITGTIDPASSFNLIGVGGSSGLTNGVNNNQVGVASPGLGVLADNGGPTATVRLLPGSPALNSGSNALATAAGLTIDQRGEDRIANTTVDIGAFEVQVPSTMTVDSLADSNIRDGVLTLREAILLNSHVLMHAELTAAERDNVVENASAAADTIQFSVTGAISLLTSLPNLSQDVSIAGPGAASLTVTRTTGSAGIFSVSAGVAASFSGLTISDADSDSNPSIFGDGNPDSVLTIDHCIVTGNTTGTGVFSYGAVTIANSTISNNGSGISAFLLTLTNSTISGNQPNGGISLNGPSSEPASVLTNDTIIGNVHEGNGGGISARAAPVNILNCTIANNTSNTVDANSGGGGGGLYTFNAFVTIINSTIVDNSAALAGNPGFLGGGGVCNNDGDVELVNTIVAQNTASVRPDITNLIVDSFNSLIGNGSGGNLVDGVNGNIVGGNGQPVVDPMLGALANNGGPTKTFALLAGSLGLNAGDDSVVGAPWHLVTDQRGPGFARASGAHVDIGAFEVQAAGPPIVASTQVSDGSAQRSRVADLTITFSTQVTFAGTVGNAFTLSRNVGGAVNFSATANVINGVTVVTLNNFTGSETQFGSLKDGRYTLTALANQISAGGQALDGDGDGQPGGDYHFGDAQGLFRFFGDINGDRHVDIADFGLFSATFNLSTGQTGFLAAFDFNGDGHIDIADFGQFSIRFFTPLP